MYSIETVRVHYGTMAVQNHPPACPILVYQFKKREWKTHKIKKCTPRHQKPGSAKPIESRNTLPNVQTKGVEKSKNQEMHSLKPKSKECISPKNKKYAPDHQNPGSAKAQKARNTLSPPDNHDRRRVQNKHFTENTLISQPRMRMDRRLRAEEIKKVTKSIQSVLDRVDTS